MNVSFFPTKDVKSNSPKVLFHNLDCFSTKVHKRQMKQLAVYFDHRHVVHICLPSDIFPLLSVYHNLNSTPVPNRETPTVRPMEKPVPRTFASTCPGLMATPVSADRPTVAFTGPAEAEALASSALANALALRNSVEASVPALGPLASASNMLHSARARLSVVKALPGRSMVLTTAPHPGITVPLAFTTAEKQMPCFN